MELLLWRWSTAVQIASALMVAVFFVAFARSVRTVEVRIWMRAWLANLAALGVTLFFWYFRPDHLDFAVRVLYIGCKTLFVLLMMEGAWTFAYHRQVMALRTRWLAAALFGVASGFLLDSLALIGIGQHSVMSILFLITAFALFASRKRASAWLGAGFLLRAILAGVEALAYAAPAQKGVSLFLSASSSFDSGAEWFLALGCVLATSSRIHDELQATNRDLLSAQDELRALADRDPLTGLANRRSLPSIFREVFESGATIVFFDLDDFKTINDAYGHQKGDDVLKQFAAALRASFRPSDAVVRFAGDEFVVVAPGLARDIAQDHVADLANRLGDSIAFSAGSAELRPGGDAEAALRAADDAMYQSKALHHRAAG